MKGYSKRSREAFPELSGEGWLLREEGWNPKKQGYHESIFAQGNGYAGLRGFLEEIPPGSYAGTYLAGVYDGFGSQTPELVNLPNPIKLRCRVGEEGIFIGGAGVLEHSRVLDMGKALLARKTIFASKGRRYEYGSTRFLCAHNPHLGAMRVSICPLDADAELEVESVLDGTTGNVMRPLGGRFAHYRVLRTSVDETRSALVAQTKQAGTTICCASGLRPHGSIDRHVVKARKRKVVHGFKLRVSKNARFVMDEIFCIHTSRETTDPLSESAKGLDEALGIGYDSLLDQHARRWGERWSVANVEIEGDQASDLALRFNLYHMLSAASEQDFDAGVPAKALTGEWYSGHMFWDTEAYLLAPIAFLSPKAARNMLMYRYRRLEEARRNARLQGYGGALFPWESADTGEEVTPPYWRDFDGRMIRVYNSEREHHIEGAIAHAIELYASVTSDREFESKEGAEMLFEIARFWASRSEPNERTGEYEIKRVIGPNEFQKCVDNNAYTNFIAKRCLELGARLHSELERESPAALEELDRRIGLTEQEVKRWKAIAERIRIPERADGLIEEFDGYFERRDVKVSGLDESGMPLVPEGVFYPTIAETQLVKQADVVLALALFPRDFSREVKQKNFDYYEARCLHKSSLSPAMHGLVALDLGDADKALKYFDLSSNLDLGDLHGNARLGVHIAAMGGAWQLAINGFGGVRAGEKELSINPRLPSRWSSMRFKVRWRGSLLGLEVDREGASVSCLESEREEVPIELFGKTHLLKRGQTVRGHRD